jgi:hypothetical protein
MYNKIFTRILDSSIWLEPDPTRIIWITLLASMDEDGFCYYASPRNLAARANITLESTLAAIATLEGPDPDSADPSNEGRRIERVPGGWYVINAPKFRGIVSYEESKRRHRERQAKYRAEKNGASPCRDVTSCHTENSTRANSCVSVPQSETETETEKAPPLSSEQVGRAVRETIGISGKWLTTTLDDICRSEIKSGKDPEALRDELISAWRDYAAAGDKIEFRQGAEKFFGERTWANRDAWKWKEGCKPATGKYWKGLEV